MPHDYCLKGDAKCTRGQVMEIQAIFPLPWPGSLDSKAVRPLSPVSPGHYCIIHYSQHDRIFTKLTPGLPRCNVGNAFTHTEIYVLLELGWCAGRVCLLPLSVWLLVFADVVSLPAGS